jgi:maleate isomerase
MQHTILTLPTELRIEATPQRRVGVIVPPENPTVEPELAGLIGSGTALHVARLPLTPGAGLRGRLEGYRAGLDRTLDQFGELRLSAMLIACTGAFYPLGPAEDERLCRQLSDRHGLPVQTATRAILEALQRLEARRIVIVSPYPSWLTEAARGYWTAAGLDVTRTVEFAGGRSIYSIGAGDVLAGLRDVVAAGDDVDAILVSGTGVPTVAAIQALAAPVAPALLSSNLCGGRWLMETAPLPVGSGA